MHQGRTLIPSKQTNEKMTIKSAMTLRKSKCFSTVDVFKQKKRMNLIFVKFHLEHGLSLPWSVQPVM